MELSAEGGNVMAQTKMCGMYEKSDDPNDHAKAISIWKLAAAQEYSLAQSILGWKYQYASGVEKDLDEAIRLYKLAIDQGLPNAMDHLGNLYELENDPRIDPFRHLAPDLFRKAADLGWEKSMCSFGKFCENQKDYPTMMEYYEKAAAKGCSLAFRCIGWIYKSGERGFPQDLQKAFEYFMGGAKRNDMKSMLAIAKMYETGEGVETDLKEAENCYKMVIEHVSKIVLAYERDTYSAIRAAREGLAKLQAKVAKNKK